MLNFPLPDLLDEKPFHWGVTTRPLRSWQMLSTMRSACLSKNLSAGRSLKFHRCSSVSVLKYVQRNHVHHIPCKTKMIKTIINVVISVFFLKKKNMFREIHGVNISLLDFEGLWFGRPGCQWIDQFKRAPEPALFQQCHTVNLDWLLILYYRYIVHRISHIIYIYIYVWLYIYTYKL